MTNIIRCAIYARYSNNNQREASIEDQVRKCREYAASRGWEILIDHIYADKAISGKSISEREQFKKMMSIATSGASPFNKILVDDTSRIARNTRDALGTFSILTFYSVYVYYVSQGIDSSDESAEEMITIHGLIDSIYLKNLARATHRGVEGQVLKGYSGGGRRYGYRSKPVYNGKVDIYGNPEAEGYQLEIKPDEAETVIRIFKMYGEEGLSGKRIVTILNKEIKETGSPVPPRGRYWKITSIFGSRKWRRGILNNEIYIGKYYWNCSHVKHNPENNKRLSVRNDKSKWKILTKPSLRIIPENLWTKVKARQKEVRDVAGGSYAKGRKVYSKHLLTGVIKCPDCGGNLVIVSGGKYAKYGCSANWNGGESACSNNTKTPKSLAEEEYVARLGLNFNDEESKAYLLNKVNEMLAKKEDESSPSWLESSLEKELKKTEKELSNILNAIRAGVITPSVTTDLKTLESRKSKIEIKLKTVPVLEEAKKPTVKISLIADYCQNLASTISANPLLGRRLLAC